METAQLRLSSPEAEQRVQPTLLAQPSTSARLFSVVLCRHFSYSRRLPAARLTPTFGGFPRTFTSDTWCVIFFMGNSVHKIQATTIPMTYSKSKTSMITIFILLIILFSGCTEKETDKYKNDRQWDNEINTLLREINTVSSQSIPVEVSAGPIDGNAQSMDMGFRFVTPEDVIIDAKYTTGNITNTFEMKQYPATKLYWNAFTVQERDEGYAVLRQSLLSPSSATHIALAALGLSTPFGEDSHGGLVLRWDKETQSTFKATAIWTFLYLEQGDNNAIISHRVIMNAQDGVIIEINRDW